VELIIKHYNEGTHPLNPTPCLNVGGKTYKLKTVVYENKCTAEGGIAAANRLVFQDGAKYVLGTICSGASMASSEAVFTPNKVVFFSTGWNPNVIGEDKPYTFRLNPTGREYAEAFVQWATEGGIPDLKTVAYSTVDNEAGRGTEPAKSKVAEKFGLKIVASEFFPVGTTDYYPYLTRIMAKKPDMIDITADSPDEGLHIKQLRELGYEGVIKVNCDVPTVLIEAAGGQEAVEGVYCSSAFDWDSGPPYITQQMANFRDEIRKDYPGNEPTIIALLAYDAGVGLFESMKMAGTIEDTDKVRDVLKNYKWMLSTGYMSSWGGKERYGVDRQVVQPISVSQMKNGVPVIVGMPIVPVP
jgi:branched-chain amino acid transport system substrate-binding protein